MHVCFCCVTFSFRYLAKGLAGKNVSEMTYFVSGGTQNINSVNQYVYDTPLTSVESLDAG